MRKFIPVTTKGVTTIYECDVVIEQQPMFLKRNGEELCKVLLPKKYENELWYSHFFSDSKEDATIKIAGWIKDSFERELSKFGKEYSAKDIEEKLALVNVEIL